MPMTKILVAHDFSQASDRALDYAHELARDVGARMELVYVLPDLHDGRGDHLAGLPATDPGQLLRYMDFLRSELERRARATLRSATEPEFGTYIRRGDPAKRITELAEELGADAICVAATGKGAVARFLMGSTSSAVLRESSVAVLVVP